MDTRQAIIDQADAAHSQYPQYAGHWDGEEWQLVEIVRPVRTKMGEAFKAGDVTIARREEDGICAYSTRNHIDTAVPPNSVRWI